MKFVGQFYSYLIIFPLSILLSILFTKFSIIMGLRFGIVDRPSITKTHLSITPRIGGIAFFLTFISIIIPLFLYFDSENLLDQDKVLGLLLGSLGIVILGIIDDIVVLKARKKLIGQIVVCILVYLLGFRIGIITNPFGGDIKLPFILDAIMTIIWFLAFINAINLIDGLDGLATGIVLIATSTLFFIFLARGFHEGMVFSIITIGSCIGFLFFNFPPARIYLGDTGSMFLGFFMASLGLLQFQKGATIVTTLVPMSILAVPLLDTLFAIIRRSKKKGHNIFGRDTRHIHHRLVSVGLSDKDAVLFLCVLSLLLGFCAILLSLIPDQYAIILVVLLAIILFMNIKILTFIENRWKFRIEDLKTSLLLEKKELFTSLIQFKDQILQEIRASHDNKIPSSILIAKILAKNNSNYFFSEVEIEKIFKKLIHNLREGDLVTFVGNNRFAIFVKRLSTELDGIIARLQDSFNVDTIHSIKIIEIFDSSDIKSIERFFGETK